MTREIFVFKSHVENEAGRLVPDFFLFFKKALFEVKASGLQLSFNIFRQPSTWHTISRDMLNFLILEKSLGIVSPPHFVYDFLRKMFLILCSVN